jgi:hypothetical protein
MKLKTNDIITYLVKRTVDTCFRTNRVHYIEFFYNVSQITGCKIYQKIKKTRTVLSEYIFDRFSKNNIIDDNQLSSFTTMVYKTTPMPMKIIFLHKFFEYNFNHNFIFDLKNMFSEKNAKYTQMSHIDFIKNFKLLLSNQAYEVVYSDVKIYKREFNINNLLLNVSIDKSIRKYTIN